MELDAAVAASDARYCDLIAACDQPIVVAVDGVIVLANDAATGLFGAADRLRIVGRRLAELIVPSAAGAVADDSAVAVGAFAASSNSPPHATPPARAEDAVAHDAVPVAGGAAADYIGSCIRRLDGATVAVTVASIRCHYQGRPALQVLIRDVSERRKLENRVQYLTRHDVLTDLPNRTDFRDRMQGAIARARRNSRQVAVMLVNVHHFKAINTIHGADAGDAVLREIASRLKNSVRAADAVARIAGDEFALILEALDQREQAAVVAQRVIAVISEPIDHDGARITLTASAGIAAFPSDGSDVDALMRMADVAMYAAKEAGRAGYRFYFSEMEALTQRDAARHRQTAMKLETLTPRERDVLEILLEGKSNKAIGYVLGASPRTIENHRARVMMKMEADSLPDLVRMIVELRHAVQEG